MKCPRTAGLRPVMLAVAVTHALAGHAAAQSAPACASPACGPASLLWTGAAQIHQFKNEFVAALRQFAEAAAGSYGDEGSKVSSSLDAMETAVVRWDQAITAYETTYQTAAASAELDVALASVYLDRNRISDSLRELTAAAQLAPARADVHILAALAHDLANDPAKAAQELRKALTIEPGNLSVSYNLAQHLARIGQRVQAQQAWQRFQEAQQPQTEGGGAPGIQFDRANLLRQAAGVAPIFPPRLYAPGLRLLTTGRYQLAIATLRAEAMMDPLVKDLSTSRAAPAGAALRRGQLSVALSQLTAAITVAPTDSEAHRLLGLGYWADDQDEKSIEQLRTAARLDPHDERSRMALVDVLVASGRDVEAARSLQEALQVIPESGQAHYRLGLLYQRQSLIPSALEAFEKAVTSDPLVGLDHLYETIGGLYANQATFDRAVEAYAKRIEVNPNNADAHRKLGEIYFLQGQNDEALAEFTTARLLDPKNADAYAASGQVYLRLNRFADALSMSRRAVALDPEHQKARYALATSLMRLGQIEEGRKELDTFQRMVAESTASLQRKSELDSLMRNARRSLASGDYDSAVTLLRQALADDPRGAQLYLDLGQALMKAGHIQEALDSFVTARNLEDGADVHRYLSEAYRTLGRTVESRTEDALYEQSTARMKAQRLHNIGQLP